MNDWALKIYVQLISKETGFDVTDRSLITVFQLSLAERPGPRNASIFYVQIPYIDILSYVARFMTHHFMTDLCDLFTAHFHSVIWFVMQCVMSIPCSWIIFIDFIVAHTVCRLIYVGIFSIEDIIGNRVISSVSK